VRRLIVIAMTWAALVTVTTSGADAQSPAGTRFTLTGVVFVEGGTGRAWLVEPSLTQNQVVSVRPGDNIGAYRLSRVLEDRVEMEGPSGKFVVLLAGTPAAATPVTQAPPRQAPAPVPQITPDTPRPPVEILQPGDPRRKFDFRSIPTLGH